MQNKQEIINELKKRCDKKLELFKENKKKMLIFTTISSFLKDGDEFFISVSADTAINVLMDLDFEKEKAKELYLKLICQQ